MKGFDKVISLMKNMKHLNMRYFIMAAFRANFLEAILVSSYT